MAKTAGLPDIAGEDLNRCERVTVLQTQDCKVSKRGCCTASSQYKAVFEKGYCTLVWTQWKSVAAVRREKTFLFRVALHKLQRLLFYFARRRPFLPSHNLLSTKAYGHSFAVRSNSSCCNAGTSHRFKAFSPPFCAKNRFRLVPSETSVKIFSGRALNRGRRTESSP